MHAPGPITRREFLRLAGLSAAGTALAACQPHPIRPSASSQKVELVYQDCRAAWFSPMVSQMLAEFHQTHPNIHVFYVPDPQNPVEQMPADLQAGTAADVFQGCCTYFPTWAQQGFMLDLKPFVQADIDQETIADWDPAQYKALFTRDGKQYGLPKYHGTLALYYNKDLFDQFKVDYPDASWTHDDYLRAMSLLTGDRDGDGQTDGWGSLLFNTWDRLQVHVNAWGGHFVDPADPTHSLMDRPEASQAIEWLRARMWDDRVMPTLKDLNHMRMQEVFLSGRVAMLEEGSWILKDVLSGAGFRFGVAPLPSGPVCKAALTSTDSFGIYAGTKHPEAAWELMKFLVSKEYGRAMAKANFLQPARASLIQDWVGFIQDEFPQPSKDVDLLAFADGQIKGYSVAAEIFANMTEAGPIAQDAWDQILTFGQAPVESLKAASQKIEAVQHP